jgi:hypothetical protein
MSYRQRRRDRTCAVRNQHGSASLIRKGNNIGSGAQRCNTNCLWEGTVAADEQELRLLGVLEASLGARQRAANGVTPDERVCAQTLAEMIALGRHIDEQPPKQRSALVRFGRVGHCQPARSHRRRPRSPREDARLPGLVWAFAALGLVGAILTMML